MEEVNSTLITVRFFNSEKTYDYLTNPNFKICYYDFVIVPIKDDFTVGQVVGGKTLSDNTIVYKQIAYKIDLEKFKLNTNRG